MNPLSASPPTTITTAQLPIVLYHYPFSPYARRVVWYLRLRGISYMQCIQPPTLPRPDLAARLSIAYRRIPLLAVGRDVYLDTRLILRKLETVALPEPWTAGAPPLGCAAAFFGSSSGSSGSSLPAFSSSRLGQGRHLGGGGGGGGGSPVRGRGGAGTGKGEGEEGKEGGGVAAEVGEALALERLLSIMTTSGEGAGGGGGGLFFRAAELLPEDLPLMRDPAFRRDRQDFFHGGRGKVNQKDGEAGAEVQADAARGRKEGNEAELEERLEKAAARAEALREVRDAMALVEHTLLADGREWILGDKSPTAAGKRPRTQTNGGPSLADIEAVWIFHWLTGLPGALFDAGQAGRDRFPRVYAWVERFQAAVGAAKAGVRATTVDGADAAAMLTAADYWEPEAEVDPAEPIVGVYGLHKGCPVEVWPTDSGAAHRDRGRLVGIGADEVVWETDAGVRVHAPRHGFRVRRVDDVALERGSSL